MTDLYCSEGTIESISSNGRNSIILILHNGDNKPPVMLEAIGEMAKYIEELEMTDDEERYLKARYYYNSYCGVRSIEIPAEDDSGVPAKIVCLTDDYDLRIYGQQEHISTDNPQPMSQEDYARYYAEYRHNVRIVGGA